MIAELVEAFFHRDGIDHSLALHAFQAGFDHLPFGAVNHHRHTGNVGLSRHQVEECGHGFGAIQHAFIHVHIDDLGAILDLLTGDFNRGRIIAIDDELSEPG